MFGEKFRETLRDLRRVFNGSSRPLPPPAADPPADPHVSVTMHVPDGVKLSLTINGVDVFHDTDDIDDASL